MERIKRGLRGYNISISPSNDGVILEEDDGIVIEAKRKNGTYTASYTYPYSELEFQADVCVAFIKHVRSGEDKFLNNKQLIDTTKTSRYRFLNLNTGKYGASFVFNVFFIPFFASAIQHTTYVIFAYIFNLLFNVVLSFTFII